MERSDNGKNVPSLVGLTLVQAQDKATSRGFTLKIVRRPAAAAPGTVVDQAPQAGADLDVPVVIQIPSQQPQGTVIAQDPPANQQVPAHSKVRINVSGGPASTQTQTVTTSQTTTRTTRTATTVTTTTP